MDVGEFVVSAGRAVLEAVEREWQPLSAGELEQRLDQAVEEILEAELLAGLKHRPQPAVFLQLLQGGPGLGPRGPNAAACGPAEEARITDLLQNSKSQARMAGRARLSLPHTVLLSLTLLSERISYRSVSRRFHLEKGNVHRIFFSFCERINSLEEKLIRWPVGGLATGDDDGQSLPQVLGVLGQTRIPIRLPIGKHDVESQVPEVRRMKKEAHPDSWLNLELLCNQRGQLLHCRISKGSDTDRGSALRDKLKQQPKLMPPGSFLVARAGYPLTAQILTPYTESLGQREELFNATLEEHFQILDQVVANLKARFQRLRYLDIGNYSRARAVVLTACVLHNVFLDLGQVIQGEVKQEETISREGEEEEEVDEDGKQTRNAISDLLLKSFETARI
uniref:Elongin B n=1 Tax=Echeneis naucrates TaxID=173247 RepID=A0A665T2B8_ECHNA